MIWYLTRGNHKWAIHPLVRAWLRADAPELPDTLSGLDDLPDGR